VNRVAIFAVLTLLTAACCSTARGQAAGPIAPPPKFEVKKVSGEPHPEAPPVPADEIIHRFTANEDVMKKAYDAFMFTQNIRVQEAGDTSTEFNVAALSYVRPDGNRYERISTPPVSTLKQTTFTLEDVEALGSLPLFVLTSDQISAYKLTYEGTEKLDELDTYIFRVQPKQLERTRQFFDGVIWVDNRDFAIVKSSGKFVREIEPQGNAFPFVMFDTYRENVSGKYWFPTYVTSDDFINLPGGKNVPLHLVVRSVDFKPNAPPPPAQKSN